MRYEHKCRSCDFEWLEEYSLEVYDAMKAGNLTLSCPKCEGYDTYRCVGRVPVHFLGGGWSPQGYYNYEAYDQLKREGKKVTLYDRKEDLERELKGEKKEAVTKRLKRENELAKSIIGPDAAITEREADRRIKKEVDKVKA
jgi:hypothetical protein